MIVHPNRPRTKVIGSQGNFIFTETNISSPPENRSSLSKVRLVFSTIHFSGAKRCKSQNISENIWVSKLHGILFKTKYLSTLRSNYGSEDTAEQKFLRRVTCSRVFHRSVGVKKSLKNLKKMHNPKKWDYILLNIRKKKQQWVEITLNALLGKWHKNILPKGGISTCEI